MTSATRAQRVRLYTAWKNMRQRCLNETRPDYQWYGARGIKICPEWVDDFQGFLAWAMENGYQDHLTLDRINTDGPYAPWNCRWATRKAQANNRRSNRFLTMGDRTMSLAQWSEETGIEICTLWRRLRNGWPVERALTEPVHIEKRPRRVLS